MSRLPPGNPLVPEGAWTAIGHPTPDDYPGSGVPTSPESPPNHSTLTQSSRAEPPSSGELSLTGAMQDKLWLVIDQVHAGAPSRRAPASSCPRSRRPPVSPKTISLPTCCWGSPFPPIALEIPAPPLGSP